MKRLQKLTLTVATIAATLAPSVPAWAYGVEGWPQGRPDHVIQAEARKAARAAGDKAVAKSEKNQQIQAERKAEKAPVKSAAAARK